MKESLKLAVEKAKRGESEGFGTIYRETCADVYFHYQTDGKPQKPEN